MITENGIILRIKSNDLSGKVIFNLAAPFIVKKIKLKVFSCDYQKELELSLNDKNPEIEFNIENPKLWSVKNPNLYSYQLNIIYDGGEQEICGTFGIRSLSTDKKYILLNGQPIFIKGYIRGHKCHEHNNLCNLTEEEFYRKNIRQAKKFVFNFVRFHSTIPTETFFKVADEEGILVHIELRDPEFEYDNREEMLAARKQFVSDSFIKKVIDSLYNHPSLTVYCIGNEIKWLDDYSRVEEISRFIKREDDSRLFVDTCAWGQNNRKTVDIDVQHMSYYFPFGKHADMYENTENLLVCGSSDGIATQGTGKNAAIKKELHFEVPLLAHEVCHYVALNDYAKLDKKFKSFGTEKPWWIDEELKMIEQKGFTKDYPEMFAASKHFQLECWKTAYEKMRLSKLLGGFHCLQFADTDAYENSNGVVDCFDDENLTKAKDFISFNGDAVLLLDIDKRAYYSNTELCLPFYLSNFDERQIKTADFEFSLVGADGQVLADGKLEKISLNKGVRRICTVRVNLESVNVSTKCTLTATLKNADETFAKNSWNLWIYPQKIIENYNEFCSYTSENAVITDKISDALKELRAGKNVCLIYRSNWTRHLLDKKMENPEYAFKATWNRFKPVIWDRGTNCGGLCDDKLLNKFGFSTDRFYDFNYAALTDDCVKIILDDFPVPVRNIISGTDKCVRDRFDVYPKYFNLPELQYDRTLRNFSYLFELCVGKGKLLVCGLNMTGLNDREPTTVAMAEFIKNYISSNCFNPENSLSEDEFVKYMKKCAEKPVKERMMTQFWQLDDTPVESPEYWVESKKYLE